MRRASRARVVGGFVLVLAVAVAAGAEESHLPFFRAHRDWVRRAYEKLPRPAAGPDVTGRAWSFDPFADASAQAELEAVRAGLDTATTLGDLGTFRAALDSLLRVAEVQGARLDSLDRFFVRHLRTSLEVTLGTPASLPVQRVEAFLDGAPIARRELDDVERAALASGGVLEVVRRVVEPRAQTLEVRAWTTGEVSPSVTSLVVEPQPDRLSIVHLDLESARAQARARRTALEERD